MIKYIRLPLQFNISALQNEVDAISRDWPLHYNQAHYTGNWSILPLRSAGGNMQNSVAFAAADTHYADTELMNECPAIRNLLDGFACEKLAVRLMRLEPGAEVKEHTDRDLRFEEGEVRLHIPVFTNELVEFLLAGERLHMRAGECWYINAHLPHRLANPGQQARIHLVFDLVVNDWLKNLFHDPAAPARADLPDPPAPHSDPTSQRLIIAELKRQNTPQSLKLAEEMERGGEG